MKLTSRFGPIGAAAKKEVYVELRYPLNFLTGIATVFMMGLWILLAAFAFANPQEAGDSVSVFAGYAIWGLVLTMFVANTFATVANFVRREQMEGTLEQLFLSARHPQSVLLGAAIGSIAVSVITNILLIVAFSIFVKIPAQNVILALYILTVTIFMLVGYSLVFGAIMLRLKRAQSLLNFLQIILMLACGAFFPFAVIPEPLKIITLLVPLSYGVDLFRNTLMGLPPELIADQMTVSLGLPFPGYVLEILILNVLAVGLFVLGWRFYGREQNRMLRKEGFGQF